MEQECDGHPQTGDCLSILWDAREKKWDKAEGEPLEQVREPLTVSSAMTLLRRAVEYLVCAEDERPDYDG